MRNLLSCIFVFSVITLSSCDSTKKSTEKNAEPNKKAVEKSNQSDNSDVKALPNGSSLVEGIITNKYKEESCDFLIVGTKEGEELILHPANLSDEFKEDGLKVKLQYRLTRQPNTSGCNKGLFVQIEEISKL